MCYLIAKRIDAVGCIALRTSHGKHLVEFKRSLADMVDYEKIQLVTISRPSAYAEYEPYQFVNAKQAAAQCGAACCAYSFRLFKRKEPT